MFEKEAEEWARKLEESQTLGVYDNDEDLARDIGWNDGKVAGYEEGFKDGAEFGYNKANEWHEIEKENAELKAFKQDCIKLTEDNVVMAKQRGETVIQLTKAKEIIKDYLTIVKGSHITVCGVSEENRTIYILKLNEEAEQFLKDMEI